MSSDPLATCVGFRNDVLPVLEDAQRIVKAFQAARADLDARLAAAQEALQRLATAHRRAVHGWQNAAQKVRLDPATLRPPAATEAQVADLTQWLGRLVAMAATGAWREADGPLEAWSRVAQPLLAAESAVALINSGPLDQLELLRGRLTVLRAVAESNDLGLMSASAPTAGRAAFVAYRAAEQALLRQTAETRIDLAQAGVLVDRYAMLVDPRSLPDAASDQAHRP